MRYGRRGRWTEGGRARHCCIVYFTWAEGIVVGIVGEWVAAAAVAAAAAAAAIPGGRDGVRE